MITEEQFYAHVPVKQIYANHVPAHVPVKQIYAHHVPVLPVNLYTRTYCNVNNSAVNSPIV
jgi:hypothetical protein